MIAADDDLRKIKLPLEAIPALPINSVQELDLCFGLKLA